MAISSRLRVDLITRWTVVHQAARYRFFVVGSQAVTLSRALTIHRTDRLAQVKHLPDRVRRSTEEKKGKEFADHRVTGP